jgi:hypothetical protein
MNEGCHNLGKGLTFPQTARNFNHPNPPDVAGDVLHPWKLDVITRSVKRLGGGLKMTQLGVGEVGDLLAFKGLGG